MNKTNWEKLDSMFLKVMNAAARRLAKIERTANDLSRSRIERSILIRDDVEIWIRVDFRARKHGRNLRICRRPA